MIDEKNRPGDMYPGEPCKPTHIEPAIINDILCLMVQLNIERKIAILEFIQGIYQHENSSMFPDAQ